MGVSGVVDCQPKMFWNFRKQLFPPNTQKPQAICLRDQGEVCGGGKLFLFFSGLRKVNDREKEEKKMERKSERRGEMIEYRCQSKQMGR